MTKFKYCLFILLFFCADSVFAQHVPQWGGGADGVDWSFGFSFGYVNNYYKIDKQPDWRKPYIDKDGNQVTDSLKSIGSANSPGFAVGFFYRYTLIEHIEFRVAPTFVFADKTIDYTYNTPSQNITKTVQGTIFDVPLAIKIKGDRLGDFRPYIMGGLKYSQAIGSKASADADALLVNKFVKNVSGFASYEAGLGCDIYFEFFKLSPEIKLSNSIGDVLLHENHPYSTPIQKLGLHTVMFSLYFE